MTYQPVGDKQNSAFFDEYRGKIYQRRAESGLDELLGPMLGVMIQVEHGDGLAYLAELHLMTPYRLGAGWFGETHRTYVLNNRSTPDAPALLITEPLTRNFEDSATRLNSLYPNARAKPNARYIGELFQTADLEASTRVLESHNTRFEYPGDTENPLYTLPAARWTTPSDFTGNRVGYTMNRIEDGAPLGLGERFTLTAPELATLEDAAAKSAKLGIPGLVLGFDHFATRILAGEREDAILEFLTLSPHYFWGAYDIAAMNSSTNVTRNPNVDDDKLSPAKVFTANNTPSFVNSFEGLPMPTEDFVRNYGRRMHHAAFEVADGERPDGTKNVDYIVDGLTKRGVPFLADIVGSCGEEPDLKQIFSKHSAYSILITEYLERCHGYEGFFTKSNVAALTEAAGHDERYQHGHVFD